jgi:AmmeMemoRadiSam system protein B
MSKSYSDIRPSPLAGRWYPAAANDLAEMVDQFLAAAQPNAVQGKIIGLLAPHAGLVYSGPVAAHAFSLVRGMSPEVVAVISPSHYPYPASLLTTAHHAYQTPLGVTPVDQDAVAALAKQVPLTAVRSDPEHALEIELPFLQRVLPRQFTLLPVMIVEQSVAVAETLGHALAEVLADRNALLVASSDLSHFYPQNVATQLDRAMLARVDVFDPEGVFTVEQQQQGFACGRGAIAAVMWAARDLGANRAKVVYHATSGDTSGDYSRVVGYGAGVFYKAEQQSQSQP